MKMRFGDRVLLAVYAVLGIITALIIGGAVYCRVLYGYQITVALMGLQFSPLNGVLSMVVLGGVALVLLVWSIWLLHLSFRRPPKLDKSSVSVQNTENGSVRISLQAMDMLVKQAIGNTEGIEGIKTSITNHEDSITVHVDMTLQNDVHIPNVTMLMQKSIKAFIEEYSGIAVREVTIMVSKIIEVTPRPPLALGERSVKDDEPEIIDQPDAMEPDESQSVPEPSVEPASPPEEIEDQVAVSEFEADHQPPEPEPESEADDEPEASDEPDDESEAGEGSEWVPEKDLW